MRLQLTCLILTTSISFGFISPALAQYDGQAAQATAATPQKEIQSWFKSYDAVRRQAQMSPQDRAKCDKVMSQGLAMFMPGEEKTEIQAFLRTLVEKNSTAAQQLKQLKLFPETKALHIGYYQYFTTASALFNDYIRVQDHPLSKDQNGGSLAAGLVGRKANLEALDQNNKALDAQLRQQFGIPPYKF
jgi:hypothetical protein